MVINIQFTEAWSDQKRQFVEYNYQNCQFVPVISLQHGDLNMFTYEIDCLACLLRDYLRTLRVQTVLGLDNLISVIQ